MAPVHTRHPARPRRSARRLIAALAVAGVVSMLVPGTSGAEPTLGEELAATRDAATSIAEELSAIETSLARLEADIEAYDEEIAAIRDELAALEGEVREIAVQRYMAAGNGPLTYSDDLHEHQRIDVMMSAVQRDSQETMATYEAASSRLEAANRALTDRLEEQDAARERLAERLDDLAEELARLSELQRQAEAEAARLEAERRQAEAEGAAATTTSTAPSTTTTTSPAPTTTTAPPDPATTTTTTAPTNSSSSTTTTAPASTPDEVTTEPDGSSGSGTSGFLCPVRGASVFTDSWGAPRSGGRLHKGVDMLAEIGTPAVAPVSGNVTHRWNSTGGHSYHLYGDDGNYYYGTHLSEYGAEGHVSAGTVIGYVGDSGNAAGIPHLHFEIHPGGRGNAINPYPTVKAACG